MSARAIVEDEDDALEGWWLAPDATLHELEGDDHHHRWAARHLAAAGRKYGWSVGGDASEQLKADGWVRLVQEDDDLYVDAQRELTHAQRRAIRRLADDLGLDPEVDVSLCPGAMKVSLNL